MLRSGPGRQDKWHRSAVDPDESFVIKDCAFHVQACLNLWSSMAAQPCPPCLKHESSHGVWCCGRHHVGGTKSCTFWNAWGWSCSYVLDIYTGNGRTARMLVVACGVRLQSVLPQNCCWTFPNGRLLTYADLGHQGKDSSMKTLRLHVWLG